jgi:hypothetical protein
MDLALRDVSSLITKDWQEFDDLLKELVDGFFDLLQALRDRVPVIRDSDKPFLADLVSKRFTKYRDGVYNCVDVELLESQQEVLQTFVSRYHAHVSVLAFQNAVSRRSEFVEFVDFENALSLLEVNFGLLKEWVSENVIDSSAIASLRERKREERQVKLFAHLAQLKNCVKRDKLAFWCVKSFGIRLNRAYKLIKEWVDSGVLQEKGEFLVPVEVL